MAETVPWIEPAEIEELAARYPTLPRSHVTLAAEAYWPVREQIDAALRALLARQDASAGESLDFTSSQVPANSLGKQPSR